MSLMTDELKQKAKFVAIGAAVAVVLMGLYVIGDDLVFLHGFHQYSAQIALQKQIQQQQVPRPAPRPTIAPPPATITPSPAGP